MVTKKSESRNDIVIYLIEKYFDDSVQKASELSNFSKQQINDWISRKKIPQANNVNWLMHVAVAPEFQVIMEYEPIETAGSDVTVRQQISKMLGDHKKGSGIYAFYDSMANLIYIGKSDGNLFEECWTQLNASVKKGIFPKGATQPKKRLDIVRYISAYYVKASDFEDHAKHIESLILRISKPVLNSNIGHLRHISHGQ